MTKELLEIYKDLVQCNYKEPANGYYGYCTKEVLANLQVEENGNQRKGARRKQDGGIVAVPNIKNFEIFYCFDTKYGINFHVFKFCAIFFRTY